MQIKLWFEEEGRLVAQLGDNQKMQKAVEWDVLQQATKEEPFSMTFGEAAVSPILGDPKQIKVDLQEQTLRPLGERPMVEQDRAFREIAEKKAEQERLDEEAEKEKARQAAENETAERTESERIARTRGLRERVSEAQDEALEEQEEEDFPEDSGEEEQSSEEELSSEEEEQQVAEEQAAEEMQEEEEPPPPTRGRRGARAARR